MNKNARGRRSFLRAAAAAAGGLTMPYFFVRRSAAQQPQGQPASDELTFIDPQPVNLELWGRITATTPIRATTGLNQPLVGWLSPETVIPLLEIVEDEGNNPNNRTWYRIPEGFIYTPTVQAMRPYRMPQIVTDLVEGEDNFGVWAETIVPRTQPRLSPNGAIYRLSEEEGGGQVLHYYGSVHRVIASVQDDAGFWWYKIYNDKPDEPPVFVLARHLRIFQPEELTPIHAGAPKEMRVDLERQVVECYEGDQLVFSTLTSSGGGGWSTPAGEHAVVYKQPSRYMYSDPETEVFSDPDFFDLPGVPFNVFFTTLGHAIHGTYWHGDYGRPRSHGCLNVTPEAARWLWRWVEPTSPYDAMAAGSSREPGTPIIIL